MPDNLGEQEEYCDTECLEVVFQAPSNRNDKDIICNHCLPGPRSYTFFRISVPECENFGLLLQVVFRNSICSEHIWNKQDVIFQKGWRTKSIITLKAKKKLTESLVKEAVYKPKNP